MASARFPTVQALYEGFPSAASDVGLPATDEEPLAFLQRLAGEQLWREAISFSAYLLPKREAVWWGCQSLKHIQREMQPAETEAIQAAEAWVRNPGEDERRAAMRLGMLGDGRLPGMWMALGAGWSGGSIVPPEFGLLTAGPEQTARAIRAGLLIALANVDAEDLAALVQPCLASCAQIAQRAAQG